MAAGPFVISKSEFLQDANQHTESRYLSLLLVCRVRCRAFNNSQYTSQKHMGSFIQKSNKEEITLKQLIGHLYKNLFVHVPSFGPAHYARLFLYLHIRSPPRSVTFSITINLR